MLYRPSFFSISELVCPHVHNKYGDSAWMYLSEDAVVTIDFIRRTLGKAITVNNYMDGGSFTQRGLRCNLCDLVQEKSQHNILYLSAHIFGKAFDFDTADMTADEMRVWLALNKSKLPYNIRLEQGVSWCHLDTLDNGNKLTFFKP